MVVFLSKLFSYVVLLPLCTCISTTLLYFLEFVSEIQLFTDISTTIFMLTIKSTTTKKIIVIGCFIARASLYIWFHVCNPYYHSILYSSALLVLSFKNNFQSKIPWLMKLFDIFSCRLPIGRTAYSFCFFCNIAIRKLSSLNIILLEKTVWELGKGWVSNRKRIKDGRDLYSKYKLIYQPYRIMNKCETRI